MDLIQVGSVVVEARLIYKARVNLGLSVRLDESSKLPVVKALHG
jgi:pyruvate/2-oxoglutarate dehydrogenase complex dihydrolipoamide acyltransferase (E2) component